MKNFNRWQLVININRKNELCPRKEKCIHVFATCNQWRIPLLLYCIKKFNRRQLVIRIYTRKTNAERVSKSTQKILQRVTNENSIRAIWGVTQLHVNISRENSFGAEEKNTECAPPEIGHFTSLKLNRSQNGISETLYYV